MGGITIGLRGRPWQEIEESLSFLSVLDPCLAMADDILAHMKIPDCLPLELKSLVADYAASTGPIDQECRYLVQLRIYALYKCGRVRSAMYCISCLRYGADEGTPKTYGYWLQKLAMEMYYGDRYAEASETWLAAHRSADGTFVQTINTALALQLVGNFVASLAMINSHNAWRSEKDWTPLIRGRALAGLQMYDEALDELSKCIKQSSTERVTAQAVELKRTIEVQRHKTSDPLEWILEAHRRAAQAHPWPFPSDDWYPIPESLKYRIPFRKKTESRCCTIKLA